LTKGATAVNYRKIQKMLAARPIDKQQLPTFVLRAALERHGIDRRDWRELARFVRRGTPPLVTPGMDYDRDFAACHRELLDYFVRRPRTASEIAAIA
jgi:hypothetical protein